MSDPAPPSVQFDFKTVTLSNVINIIVLVVAVTVAYATVQSSTKANYNRIESLSAQISVLSDMAGEIASLISNYENVKLDVNEHSVSIRSSAVAIARLDAKMETLLDATKELQAELHQYITTHEEKQFRFRSEEENRSGL